MDRITLGDEQDYLDYRTGTCGTVEIFDILVNTERRVGKGRRLVLKLIEETDCRVIYAFTRKSNAIAQDFYYGLGFSLAAQLNEFYTSDQSKVSCHALMFVKHIERS